MSFSFTTTIKSFLLPGDGDEALAEFLAALRNPFETYIVAYNFSLTAMIDEILAAHLSGVPIHIYLDHTQSAGPSEKEKVKKLFEAGVDITIGTSPKGSAFICHTKGFMVKDDPANPYCWTGSVNFSQSGFSQVNTAEVFRSPEWAAQFSTQFSMLKAFAWGAEKKFQLGDKPNVVPLLVTAAPEAAAVAVAVKETTTTITETIASGEVPGKEQ